MATYKFTAFENADLFGSGRIEMNAEFTLPLSPTVEVSVTDNDENLSGDARFNEFGDDLSGQTATLTRADSDETVGYNGRIYAENVWELSGDDGQIYKLVEVEQPGFLPDNFTFLGNVPPAGTSLTVVSASNVKGTGLAYDDLGAGDIPPNIVDIAAGSDDFNILVMALQTAGLDGLVRDADDITVFAPTDAAFTQLAVDLGFDGDPTDEGAVFAAIAGALTNLAPDGDPIPLLQNILSYHVSPGAKTAAEVDAADQVTTLLDGATFGSEGTELVDNEPDIDNPNIVAPDIAASNGTIQVIDRVLLPIDIPGNGPNIVDIAAGSDDFNILVMALQTAGLDGLVRDADDITVFAPTDAAFTQLAVDLGFDGDATDEGAVFGFIAGALAGLAPDGDPIPLLQNILSYHVSPGAKTAAEVDAADQVTTLLDGATFGSEGTELVDNEPDIENPNIVAPDIAASNGTIQVIDRVLLPIDIPGNEPNIVDIAAGSDDFNILVMALQTAGLDGLVRDADDITVFAPTDAAFAQLAVDLGFEGDTADEGAVFGFIAGALTDLAPDGDPIPLLQNILSYHVSPGAKTAAEVDAADQVTTLLDGATFGSEGTELVDNEPDIDNPNIVAPDIAASNGTIQVIDRVLVPIDIPGNEPVEPTDPTLAGIVAASGGVFDDDATDFDILFNAVQAAGLVEALDDPDASLTVFAPNDAAFVALSQALGFEGGDEAGAFDYLVEALALLNGGDPIGLLQSVLQYHVAPGELGSDEVLNATSIQTLLDGATLGVDGTTLVDADPDIADPNLIATDVPASNGVAHVLDGVLLPADLLQSDGSNDVDFLIKGDQSDYVRTGRDNDFVDGNGGNDKILLGRGDDVGFGGLGKDKVFGGRGDDSLSGDEGADYLSGGRGDDMITGGADNDLLAGGLGADTFIFNLGDGHDKILRFQQGQDTIDLSGAGISGFDELSDMIETSLFGATIHVGEEQSIYVQAFNLDLDETDFIFAPSAYDTIA